MELAQLAESLGYDHLWVYDHVETVPRREPTHVFEAFTMLAALSQQTTRVGLGQLVTCASYRNAGLLAKEAACIDVYSGGRLILGLGAGWFHEEYHSYGYEYLADPERLAVLDETLEVVRRLWTRGDVTFDGDHLHFDGAYCDPKPVQHLPPVLVGGGGEQVNLRIAARQADLTNWQVGLEAFDPQVAAAGPVLRGGRAGRSRRSTGPTARTAGSSTPTPRRWRGASRTAAGTSGVGGTDRAVPGRQPGGHRRAGDREDPGLRRRRLPRTHPVAARLPGRRDPAPVHQRGRSPAGRSRNLVRVGFGLRTLGGRTARPICPTTGRLHPTHSRVLPRVVPGGAHRSGWMSSPGVRARSSRARNR